MVCNLQKELSVYKEAAKVKEIGDSEAFRTIQEMRNYAYEDMPKILHKEGGEYKDSVEYLRYISSRVSPHLLRHR